MMKYFLAICLAVTFFGGVGTGAYLLATAPNGQDGAGPGLAGFFLSTLGVMAGVFELAFVSMILEEEAAEKAEKKNA